MHDTVVGDAGCPADPRVGPGTCLSTGCRHALVHLFGRRLQSQRHSCRTPVTADPILHTKIRSLNCGREKKINNVIMFQNNSVGVLILLCLCMHDRSFSVLQVHSKGQLLLLSTSGRFSSCAAEAECCGVFPRVSRM